MNEYIHLGILFAVGTVAGFVNVTAGGGSTLTLPVLIFLGLNSALANGTNRVAILIQNIFAISSFKRRKVHQFKESSLLSLLTIPGAIAGALISVRINDEWFQRILAIVMIGIVISMFIPQKRRDDSAVDVNKWLLYPALIGTGFYGGFIQVGVGFLFMAALYHIARFDLVRVNMHKVFIILIYTIPSLYIFARTGNVNWKYGLGLAAGNALGGWYGAHASVKGGEKLIRNVLVIAIMLMSLKLLGFKI